MKIKLLAMVAVMSSIITGCINNYEPEEVLLETAEEHIQFIIEKYSFGEYEVYIKKCVNNEYATNEFLIDSLADSYSEIQSITYLQNDEYRVKVDGDIILRITLSLENNILQKLAVKEEIVYE